MSLKADIFIPKKVMIYFPNKKETVSKNIAAQEVFRAIDLCSSTVLFVVKPI